MGTWHLNGQECYNAVRWALEAGYRHIDTAEGYGNEAEIGRALIDSGIPRKDIFIATKASSVAMGAAEPSLLEAVFMRQLGELQTDYVDVYMLHTPPPDSNTLQLLWMGLERLYDAGRVRSLGISNADPSDLEKITAFARVQPTYMQNIFKVYKPGQQMLSDADMISVAKQHGIAVMGYSAATSWPHILPPIEDPHVLNVAARVGRSPSQVLHRWSLQHGVGVLPKSSKKYRIRENAALLDFALGAEEMALLDSLASLAESGSTTIKPLWREDTVGLGQALAEVAGASSQPPPQPIVESRPPWGSSPADGSPELLARTRDQGFSYASVQQHLGSSH